MIQYRDGSFSETLPFDEAMKRFQQEMEEGSKPLKAFHVGTFHALESEKAKQAVEERVRQNECKDCEAKLRSKGILI